jgi:hypothetical protein
VAQAHRGAGGPAGGRSRRPGPLAQARRRVGVAPLRFLFDLLRGPAVLSRERGTWWRGLLVCAIDGTVMTVPDSPVVAVKGGSLGDSRVLADEHPGWRVTGRDALAV